MRQRISKAKSLLHWLVVPFIATSMLLWPTYSSGLEILQTDPGDTLLCAYLLEHAYQHLTSLDIFNPDQFWSPTIFWPVKGTLAWSEHLLGQTMIYGIFRPILNPIYAYVCWISATLVLNYISMRKALTKISPKTKDIWLSISTLVTTFSPAIAIQLGHPQLLSLFIIGPILYECHRLITEKTENFTLSNWAYLSFLLLINGFFNIYTFVYACYGVMICSAIHIYKRIVNRSMRLRLGNNLILNGGCLVIAGLINLCIYMPYLQTLETFGSRPIYTIINNLPKPAGWLLGNDWLLVPPAWTYQTVNPSWISGYEQAIFPGWGLLILLMAAVLTVFKKQKNAGVIQNWLISITLMILLTLSFDGKTGWLVMMKLLPGSGSLRASSRVAMMIILFSAPCIAIAAENWKLNLRKLWNVTCEVASLSASFVSIWAIPGGQYQFPYKEWEKELTAVSNALKNTDCDVFWYQWRNQEPFRGHILAMHAQSRSNIPTANGYSGQFPSDDWPFRKASGRNAFRWLSSELPKTKHSSRDTKNYPKKCIIYLDVKGNAQINHYDSSDKIKKLFITIIENKNVSIAEDENQHLYAKIKVPELKGEWKLILRRGKPISAFRGNGKFRIKNATLANGKLFITDIHNETNETYRWEINPKSGFFIKGVKITQN